ncbi:hypothetical protein DFR29_103274 [Tahibacter aquaticus]|uniref:Uncharacterized protein n=1 Tax=Tahibacter aquaticus TaxID=520092 RepID=A0A4R6Z4W9_9GAMM|nr:hypothetical protein DFR29_103274 [Tahibacter aquaticus]
MHSLGILLMFLLGLLGYALLLQRALQRRSRKPVIAASRRRQPAQAGHRR